MTPRAGPGCCLPGDPGKLERFGVGAVRPGRSPTRRWPRSTTGSACSAAERSQRYGARGLEIWACGQALAGPLTNTGHARAARHRRSRWPARSTRRTERRRRRLLNTTHRSRSRRSSGGDASRQADRVQEERQAPDSRRHRYGDRLGSQFAGAMTYFSFLSLVPILMVGFSVGRHRAAEQSGFARPKSGGPDRRNRCRPASPNRSPR